MNPIIFLWTHPRSLSTAFERSMRERGDLQCFHEPFMYFYYVEKRRVSFAHFDIDPLHPTRFADICDLIIEASQRQPVFVKDMGYYLAREWGDGRLDGQQVIHSFLIRHPAKSIASYFKLDPDFSSEEVGLCALHEHVSILRQMSGKVPAIVDADDLLANPEAVMRKYCGAVGLEFLPGALQWASKTPQDWGAVIRWHESVSRSTGFRQTSLTPVTSSEIDELLEPAPQLRRYYEAHIDAYKALHQLRLQV